MVDIQLPDGSIARFPDEMPHTEIESVLKKQFGEESSSNLSQDIQADTSAGRTILEQGLQGVTFGFADEIEAIIGAGFAKLFGGDATGDLSFGELRDEALKASRNQLERQMDKRTALSIVSQLGGGLFTGGKAAGTKAGKAIASRVASGALPARAAKSAAVGATSGAAYGAGTAEEGQRAEGATEGAIFGGILGGAIPVAVSAVKNTPGAFKVVFKGRDADKILAARLNGQELPVLRQQLADGSEITVLADIAGDEVRGLTRAVGRISGGSKDIVTDFLENRSKGAVERVTNLLSQKISNVDRYFGNLDDIAAARSRAAQPIYEAAFKKGIGKGSSALDAIVSDDRVQAAIKVARREYGVPKEVVDKSLPALDGAKKVIDDVIGAAKRAGKNEKAASFTNLKKQLVGALDEVNPEYAKARAIFSDYKALEQAQQAGFQFTRQSPEQLQRYLKNMNPAELDAYRVGVREALQRIVEKTADGGDPAKRIFGNTLKRNQLEVIFGRDKGFKTFKRRLEEEMAAAETKFRVIGGSRTDINLAEDGSQLINAATDALEQGQGGLYRQITDSLGTAIRNRYAGITRNNANKIAKILTDKDQGLQALDRLINKQSGVQRRLLKEVSEDLPNQLGFAGKTSITQQGGQ